MEKLDIFFLPQNKTVVVVHRLSTNECRSNCSFRKGKIIELGTHERELVTQKEVISN
jgi:ABC-type transport system involved in Fe-S cluster assembly fused permease/ATPase subunit